MRNLFGGDPYYSNLAINSSFCGHQRDTNSGVVWSYSGTGYPRYTSIGAYFDTDKHLYAGSNVGNIGTKDFTIECTVIPSAIANRGIFHVYSSTTLASSTAGLGVGINSSNWSFYANGTSYNTTKTVLLNNLYHVVLMRYAGVTKLIVNGEELYSVADTTSYTNAYTHVGAWYLATYRWWGYIRDFRITVGIAKYGTKYSPPPYFLPTHGVPASLRPRVPIALPEVARSAVLRSRTEFGGDPYFNNVVLQLPLRSHLRDESKYSRTISVNGNTIVVNDATYFDGNGDYMSFGDAAELEIGGGDFTIDVWIKLTGYSAGYSTYYKSSILTRDSLNNRALALNVAGTASSWTGLELTLFADNTTGYTGHVGTYSFALNRWYHVAAVRANGVVTLYVDGVPILREANTRIIQDITTDWYVGRTLFTAYEYYFPGYIRNLRLTKVARYTSSFTPPTYLPVHGVTHASFDMVPIPLPSDVARPPVIAHRTDGGDPYFNNVLLQLPLRSNFKDVSKSPKTVTTVGNVTIKNDSAYFDGSGDEINVASIDLLASPIKDFTVEFWGNWPTSATERRVFSADGGVAGWNSSTGIHYLLQLNTGGDLSFQYWNGSGGVGFNAVTLITRNTWTHVALTYYKGIVSIYINGKLDISSAITFVRPSGTPTFGVFCLPSDSVGSFNGYGNVRDFRITYGVARYTTSFNPLTYLPTFGSSSNYSKIIHTNIIITPETGKKVLYLDKNIQSNRNYLFDKYQYLLNKDKYWSNVRLYLKLEDNFSDSSSNNATVTDNNTVNILNVSPPNFYDVYKSAHFIAANEEYLSLSPTAITSSELTTFTIECWCYANGIPNVYPTASPGRWDLIGQPGTVGASDQMISFINTNAFQYYRGPSASNGTLSIVTPNNSAFPNRWYYLVLQADGTNWKIFIDGIERARVASTTGWINMGANLNIGRNFVSGYATWASRWNGYISNLRITNVARYSRNFEPPLLQFPTRS
jgi:hypothetical protein